MKNDLICGWLGLPAGPWPPDHYRLLGLRPGEGDPGVIERHVHQRLDAVRRYQMAHPDQATEAMNRLAQAFDCLTEPGAKSAYDAALFGTPPPAESNGTPPPLPALPPRVLPPPLPAPLGPTPQPAPRSRPLFKAEPPPSSVRIDPIREAALAPAGRAGLATLWGILRRARRTRGLLLAWGALGGYLESARRRLGDEAEEDDFVARYDEAMRLLRRFPKILGSAGQPGHLVTSLAGQDLVPTFRGLRVSQRLTLSNDWLAGRRLLEDYRDSLLDELRAVRRLGRGPRLLRALRAFFTDRPGVLLGLLGLLAPLGFYAAAAPGGSGALCVLLGLLALNAAIWGAFAFRWWRR